MLNTLAKKLFGSANERFIKSLHPKLQQINALEAQVAKLSDDELRDRTAWLRERHLAGETLDDLMVDAFATVREAGKRVLAMRHFDVQLIGGMVLHKGMIAEMRTGEGKTLVCTLAAYLNALPQKGVHVVTVNDYLAKRDSEWMGRLHEFLGLTVGCITHGLDDAQRKAAYNCDITYATNNELGFDYLRDNMKYTREEMVHRPFAYAIVDEVDSILIDEARTPLIISGPTEDNSELYIQVDKLVSKLAQKNMDAGYVRAEVGHTPVGTGSFYGDDAFRPASPPVDYIVDEKARSVSLSDEGTTKIEALLKENRLLGEDQNLYDIDNVGLVHHVNQALRAHTLFTADVDYIVKDNKVIIIDEFTGRMMEGRRYSDGLHQALEAKENVKIQNENQTLASITFQNYFRMYPKLSGMTGTAMTEAGEFRDIYKLEVIDIPTNVPVHRLDHQDEIYRTATEKYRSVIREIKTAHARGTPVLVGTVSIEKSEMLAEMLKKEKIPHQVLNARYHEQEAYIIAQAGRPNAVTIATNMAGRGTDIMLGGNAEMRINQELKPSPPGAGSGEGASRPPGFSRREREIRDEVEADKQAVISAGGLFVIATERHESRRIDNQLRGRAGRQGDPGASKFYISLEDDLMRIFGSERIDGLLQKLGMKEDEAIFHPWMSKAIERAQQKVEARNYEMRKNLLKYDDVMNDQRKVIYEQRIELMEASSVSDTVVDMCSETIHSLVNNHIPPKSYADSWETESLEKELFRVFGLHLPVAQWAKEEGIADAEIIQRVTAAANTHFAEKVEKYGKPMMLMAEKRIMLQTLDQLWKDHLLSLDHLRQGIHLRGYGQRDPLNEYKQEAFSLFELMLSQLRELVVSRLSHLEIHFEQPPSPTPPAPTRKMFENRQDEAAQPPKVGRNDLCPCGSGKKYKHCHGALV